MTMYIDLMTFVNKAASPTEVSQLYFKNIGMFHVVKSTLMEVRG